MRASSNAKSLILNLSNDGFPANAEKIWCCLIRRDRQGDPDWGCCTLVTSPRSSRMACDSCVITSSSSPRATGWLSCIQNSVALRLLRTVRTPRFSLASAFSRTRAGKGPFKWGETGRFASVRPLSGIVDCRVGGTSLLNYLTCGQYYRDSLDRMADNTGLLIPAQMPRITNGHDICHFIRASTRDICPDPFCETVQNLAPVSLYICHLAPSPERERAWTWQLHT